MVPVRRQIWLPAAIFDSHRYRTFWRNFVEILHMNFSQCLDVSARKWPHFIQDSNILLNISRVYKINNMRCNYFNSYYIRALIKPRNKWNGSTHSCISNHLPNAKLSMSLSHVDTCTRPTQTSTYTYTRALQDIWIIKLKFQANTWICHVGENIIIYTIILMLLYDNLCRNMRLVYVWWHKGTGYCSSVKIIYPWNSHMSRSMTKPTN